MDEKDQKQQSKGPQQSKPEMRTVCVVSHAAFGHYFDGFHLPRNKAVLIDIPAGDFNAESQRPDPDSKLGRQISVHEGLLEVIDDTDDRYTGRKASEQAKGIPAAERAKRIETVRVCAFSKQPRGHYRARCFWPANSQRPIVYEVPKAMLKQLEHDANLLILSPSQADSRGERREQIPAGAISAAEFFAELEVEQQQRSADDEIYERVVRRKKAEEENRQRITRANGP